MLAWVDVLGMWAHQGVLYHLHMSQFCLRILLYLFSHSLIPLLTVNFSSHSFVQQMLIRFVTCRLQSPRDRAVKAKKPFCLGELTFSWGIVSEDEVRGAYLSEEPDIDNGVGTQEEGQARLLLDKPCSRPSESPEVRLGRKEHCLGVTYGSGVHRSGLPLILCGSLLDLFWSTVCFLPPPPPFCLLWKYTGTGVTLIS